MGKMMYVPDDLQEDLDLLKQIRASGRCYDIICYDSKEENENKERTKENKEKEESVIIIKKKNIKKDFFTPPSLDEVKAYHKELNVTTYSAMRFFNYYSQQGWRVGNSPMVDWREKMEEWKENGVKTIEKDNETRQAKNTGSQGGPEGDGSHAAFMAWIEENYPLPVADDTPAAKALKEACETFARKYDLRNRIYYRDARQVVRQARDWPSLSAIRGTVTGQTIIRVLAIHLYDLACAIGTAHRFAEGRNLVRIARMILRDYGSLNMAEVVLALNQMTTGTLKVQGLIMTEANMNAAMARFVIERNKILNVKNFN